MAGFKLTWKDNIVTNLSKFPDTVVNILVRQAQISQAKIANAAKANHGADAHSMGRYESQTGILSQSIMPGPVTVTPTGVEFKVIAAVKYAGYVEGEESLKSTKIGVYPFLKPAAEEEMPFLIARLRQSIGGTRP
jgi:hypothetical protein